MRKDKEYIHILRKEGKSYRDIQKETGVSRATLTKWFGDKEWSKDITKNRVEDKESLKERMVRLNMVRKLKLQYKYALLEAEARNEYDAYRQQSLFWVGLGMYVASGDKHTRYAVRFASSDVQSQRLFHRFAAQYLDKPSCMLLLPQGVDESLARIYWEKELGVPSDIFYKTQWYKRGVVGPKPLQYGTIVSIIPSIVLKKKLMKWLTLAQSEQFEDAGMV